MDYKERQQYLAEQGYYKGEIDGLWGKQSIAAEKALLDELYKHRKACLPEVSMTDKLLPFAHEVSPRFIAKVTWMATQLNMPLQGAAWLMAVMKFESGLKADAVNLAGSGATGLIQFMPVTAKGLGITTEKLKLLSAEFQLDYVYRYFLPYKGKLNSLEDTYMAVLWPTAVSRPDSYVLFDLLKHPTAFRQNSSLDSNKDGRVTKGEAAAKVRKLLEQGLRVDR